MGLFSAIGGLLGLVNSNPTASELAKDVSSGLDMLIYTKEEKAIDGAKMTVSATEAWLRMVEMMKSSEQVRSVTRRIIALGTIGNIFCMIWICVVVEILQAFQFIALPTVTIDQVGFTTLTWAVLKLAGVFQLGWVLATIIVFYFGPQLIQMLTSKGK